MRKARPSFSQIARSSRNMVRRTLPELSHGLLPAASKLVAAEAVSEKAAILSATARASAPSLSSSRAYTRWPNSASGRPTATAERTPGCSLTAASISAG